MIEHVLFLLIGAGVGLVVGVLPGIGILMAMTICAPFLTHLAPLDIFLFYAAMAQVSQFLGSVTTIYTGIAGEISGMMSTVEVRRLPDEQFADTIAATAVGSFFAAVLSISACWVIASHLAGMSYLLRTELNVALIILALYMLIKYSSSGVLENIALCVTGIMLGLIGYNSLLETNVMTVGISSLTAGLPSAVVMLCLFTVPQLYQLKSRSYNIRILLPVRAWPKLNYLRITQYSVVGFVGGLMPGLSTSFSSMLSYFITCRSTKDPRERIISVETANNAGAVSQLIPLIVFGFALVPSEAIVLSWMEYGGFRPSIAAAASLWSATAWYQIVAAVIGLLAAWPMAQQVIKILNSHVNFLRAAVFSLILLAILYEAYVDYAMVFVLSCLACLLLIGWLVRNKDTTALIFGYFISDRLFEYATRMHALYF